MTIKFTREEVLKRFKWRTRRKIKKHEKFKRKNPEFKKEWNDYINEIDNIIAFGISYNEDKEGNVDLDHIALVG